mmetsp:Transcript_43473/g.91333  ORF Transcript_43473/g.91333 Transcript_43473/m.91333 type:complete len:234 (-) Transcript_43473:295-996(-)
MATLAIFPNISMGRVEMEMRRMRVMSMATTWGVAGGRLFFCSWRRLAPRATWGDCSSASSCSFSSSPSSPSSSPSAPSATVPSLASTCVNCPCHQSIPSNVMELSVCLLKKVVMISTYFSTSLTVISRSGTLRNVVTMFARMGTTGLMVGWLVVGSMVGNFDSVGDSVGNSVGSTGAGVAPMMGETVGESLGRRVGEKTGLTVGSSVTGLLVGGGPVGDPVGTRGQGSSLITP